jgi:hypothetical protein
MSPGRMLGNDGNKFSGKPAELFWFVMGIPPYARAPLDAVVEGKSAASVAKLSVG